MLGKHFLLFAAILFLYVSISEMKPLLGGEMLQCYERQCPSRTTACKKVTKTSPDKTTLDTTITCLDVQDMVLKEYKDSRDNPFGPGTHFQSTSFSGTYYSSSLGNEPRNVHVNNKVNSETNTGGGIEDFS